MSRKAPLEMTMKVNPSDVTESLLVLLLGHGRVILDNLQTTDRKSVV